VNEKKLKKYLNQEAKYNGKLIYIGSLTTQLMATKFLSLSSSVLGICLTPFLMTTMTEQSMLSKMFVYATCGFFIFVTPAVFQMLTRKYVSRLYYNYETKTFTAVMFNFFMIEYSMTFKLRDLYVPDVPGVFTTMIAKKTSQNASKSRGLFVDYNLISDIDLVKRILGYDKPIDIEKYKE
jgi:transmembrane protein 70